MILISWDGGKSGGRESQNLGCQIGRLLWDHLVLTLATLFKLRLSSFLILNRGQGGVIPDPVLPSQVRVKSVLPPPFLPGCEPVRSLGQPYLQVAFPSEALSHTSLFSSSPLL